MALMVSCGGDDPDVEYARETILNSQEESRWVLNSLSVNGVEGSIESYVKECSRDDVLIFKNDDTYEVQEGGVKCDTSKEGSTVRFGLWEVAEQQDSVYFLPTDNSKSLRVRIIELESTMFKYTLIDEAGNLVQYTYLSE